MLSHPGRPLRVSVGSGSRRVAGPILFIVKARLDTVERSAIWAAHSKRCAYCGNPIQLQDLEIDHIIPESVGWDAMRLASLRRDFGLPEGFQLNSLENFLPAHRRCNSVKKDRVFNEASARFFLAIAKDKVLKIETLAETFRVEAQKERLLRSLRAGLEQGNLSLDEVIGSVADIRAFPLTKEIEFIESTWDGHSSSDDIEDLLDRPVLVGKSTSIDGVEFVNGSGASITVRTCREYRAARGAGYYAGTTLSMKMEAFLSAASAVLDAVSKVQVARVSYIRSPHVGVADMDLIPASVLPCWSDDHRDRILNLTESSLRQLNQEGRISIIDVTSGKLHIVFDFSGLVLVELLRGDLDGDGIEEILVQHHSYAVGGTVGAASIGVLHRRGPNERFEFADWEGL